MPEIAGAYRRVSSFEQSRGFSPEAQKTDIKKLAEQIDAELLYDWEDIDSGAERDLPGLTAMLTAAREGKFTVLLLTDPDRLARNFVKQLIIEEELRKLGVPIRYVDLKVDDSPEGRLMTNMRASFSEYEREKIRMRTARGRREKMDRGLVVGSGYCPYGYAFTHNSLGRVVGMAVKPSEAGVVQDLFRLAPTRSLKELAEWLTLRGIPVPKHGKSWQASSVKTIIKNPLYLGTYRYGDTTYPVEPLVDEARFSCAQRALALRRKTHARRGNGEERFALRGRLKCGHCGGVLSAVSTSVKTQRYYFCLRRESRQCDFPTLNAAALETYAWKQTTKRLRDEKWLKHARDSLARKYADSSRTVDIIRDELQKYRERLKRVAVERFAAEPGSETEQMLRVVEKELLEQLGPLATELRDRELALTKLPTDADLTDLLEKNVALHDAALDELTPSRQLGVYQVIELQIIARKGTEVPLGRHVYDLEFSALIPFVIEQSLFQLHSTW